MSIDIRGVRFFVDELPDDHIDLIDVLRSEVPPLQTWRECAIEYFKQGEEDAFDGILNDIIGMLEDKSQGTDDIYIKSLAENTEGITDINIAKAAKELWIMRRAKNEPDCEHVFDAAFQRFVEYEKSIKKTHEFFWLVKGFVQVLQGQFIEAEKNFQQVLNSANKVQANKKFLFGSYLGKGMVDYHLKRYPSALDNLSKALLQKPDCDGSIRVLTAACFFHLGHYEKAQLAIKRSLSFVTNVNQLVLMALLELKNAKVDVASKTKFYDYVLAAHQLDRSNAMVLNLLANHAFLSWKLLPDLKSTVIKDSSLLTTNDDRLCEVLEEGGLFRLNKDQQFLILSVRETAEGKEATFSPELGGVESSLVITSMDVKDFRFARECAQRAAKLAVSPSAAAESYFIIGKIAHAQNNVELAYDCYRRAVELSPDLHLAHFGAAQALFAKGDYESSLRAFEQIESRVPDDRDTQAYLGLLRGIVKGELVPYEKLKSIAPQFSFEYELWLSQGQLRLKKLSDHPVALKCFEHARKLREIPDIELLSNISTLQYYLGKHDESLESLKFIFQQQRDISASTPSELLAFVEFENIFYRWSTSVGTVSQMTENFNRFRFSLDEDVDLAVGSEIRVNDIVWRVREILPGNEFLADTLFGGFLRLGEGSKPFEVKRPNNNFCDETLRCAFNVARILEEQERLQAATALYKEIVALHPSFSDAYVRLSFICRSLNQFEQSKNWILKAKLCRSDTTEFDVLLSEIYVLLEQHDKAKTVLEDVYVKHRKDQQILLAMGNLYLQAYTAKKNDENQLKMSYKFFHPVLTDHVRNPFAAQGLGIVCALKGEHGASDAILSKIRSAPITKNLSNNLSLNSAFVDFLQQRYASAERHIFSAMKDTLKKFPPLELANCWSLLGAMQYFLGQYEESARSALKCTHLAPTKLMNWMNFCLAGAESVGNDSSGLALAEKVDKMLKMVAHVRGMELENVQVMLKHVKNKRKRNDVTKK